LGKIIDKCFRRHGNTKTAEVLDHIKALGFKYSTVGGITVAVADMKIPKEKAEYIAAAEKQVDKFEKAYGRGLISDEERYEKVIETWTETTNKVTDALMDGLERMNNIYIMAHSGARGSKNQIRQLAGMRGLMANASGKTVEVPVKSNFREGLSVMEYFTSSHGARKGLADTALRTADSGYLTRRLVDVSQDVIVRDYDCGTTETTEIFAITDGNESIEDLYDRIVGRYTIDPIVHPQTGEVLVEADTMIQEDDAEAIVAAGIEKVNIRTVLNCKTHHGVCSKCYGRNLATGKEVNIGEAVGIIAAQSIGEPGTQLTMRTFHTGGVAGGDITQGLPRVEELFEARKPKGLATITEISGRVEIDETGKRKEVVVIPDEGEREVYQIPYGARLKVKQGQRVEAGDPLTQGSINPHDIVRVKGIGGVQEYIVKEVQRVYRLQGVDINDKHIEVIVRQMLSKVKVEDPGDTDLLPGGYEDVLTFEECNEEAKANGLRPAVAKRVLLGITKASLATDSFLSAASFQETTRVLTEAAIKGKEDHLIGLKENVILGKLIPAGTGMKKYRNIAVQKIDQESL
ncbi:MAG: DNA-directed RNA polymerase subunit beta', partial [Intestinibacter sp.]